MDSTNEVDTLKLALDFVLQDYLIEHYQTEPVNACSGWPEGGVKITVLARSKPAKNELIDVYVQGSFKTVSVSSVKKGWIVRNIRTEGLEDDNLYRAASDAKVIDRTWTFDVVKI